MHITQRKEQFSQAYVHAVASAAGYAMFHHSVDDDSIDLGIAQRIGYRGLPRAPRLDLQLKCTAETNWKNDVLSFALKKKNYDDLREVELTVPRILVVVCVPESPDDWVDQNEERMVLRHCGYWYSLKGLPERPEVKTSVTVKIPRKNALTVVSLHELMRMCAERNL